MPARASRRTALTGGLAGLLALAGCDALQWPEAGPGPSGDGDGTGRGPGEEVAGTEHDAELVERAAASIGAAYAGVATFGGPARVRRALRPLAALHREHLDLLVPDRGDESATGESRPEDQRPRWRAVRSREASLADELADLAIEADSGRLARLLAAMAAGVDQHLAVLPDRPPTPNDEGGAG